MPKPVKASVKLHLPGGQATPAPPVGPALSPHGIRIGEFIKEFNDRTRDQMGVILPVVVTIYQDSTFSLLIKSPLASVLLKEAAGLAKGSGTAGKETVGQVTWEELRRIAERKMEDLNTDDIEAASRVIAGSARSMGLEVVEKRDAVVPDGEDAGDTGAPDEGK